MEFRQGEISLQIHKKIPVESYSCLGQAILEN